MAENVKNVKIVKKFKNIKNSTKICQLVLGGNRLRWAPRLSP